MNGPRFKKGETLRTLQYLSPLPRGTKVAVVDVNEKARGGVKYLVEVVYKGEKVRMWTKETCLDLPFVD